MSLTSQVTPSDLGFGVYTTGVGAGAAAGTGTGAGAGATAGAGFAQGFTADEGAAVGCG